MSKPATPTIRDRLLAAFRAIVRAEFPTLTFLGRYEYTVISVAGNSAITCKVIDPTLDVPNLVNIPQASGLLADVATPSVGATVDVMFKNGDPTRPVVVGTSAVDSASMAGGGPAVARVGDIVNGGYLVLSATATVVDYWPGTLAGQTAAADEAAAISGSVMPLTKTMAGLTDGGRIITGSPKVQSG